MGWMKNFLGKAFKNSKKKQQSALAAVQRAELLEQWHSYLMQGELGAAQHVLSQPALGAWALDALGGSGSSVSIAAALPEPDMLAWLLSMGAKPTKGGGGRTALMVAAEGGNFDCARLLLPFSDARETDDFGRDALMWAIYRSFASVEMLALLTPLSDLTSRDQAGKTALMLAMETNSVAAVRMLAPISDLTQTVAATPAMAKFFPGVSRLLPWQVGVESERWDSVDELGLLPGGEVWRESAWRVAGKHLPRITAVVEAEKLREVVEDATALAGTAPEPLASAERRQPGGSSRRAIRRI